MDLKHIKAFEQIIGADNVYNDKAHMIAYSLSLIHI